MLLCITGPLVMIFPPENKYHRITLVNDWFISLQVIGWCHQATEYFITWAFLYWKFAFRIQTQTMYEHPNGMSTGFCNKNWTSGWMVSYIWIDAHTHPTCASVQGSLPKILQSLKGMGHGITTKFGRHLSNTAANFKAIWTINTWSRRFQILQDLTQCALAAILMNLWLAGLSLDISMG